MNACTHAEAGTWDSCAHSEAQTTLDRYKQGDELDPQLRNDLAQLHGNANKLLATRIDAILTGGR